MGRREVNRTHSSSSQSFEATQRFAFLVAFAVFADIQTEDQRRMIGNEFGDFHKWQVLICRIDDKARAGEHLHVKQDRLVTATTILLAGVSLPDPERHLLYE